MPDIEIQTSAPDMTFWMVGAKLAVLVCMFSD